LLFGAIASSALVLGALTGGRLQIPKRVLAGMLAFAAGALITALTFELFEDSYERGGIWRAATGLMVGAVVFTLLSLWLDRYAQGHRAEDHGSEKLDTDAAAKERAPSPASTTGAAGIALLAAVTLDGVPENVALGVSLGRAPVAWPSWQRSSCRTFRRHWWGVPRCGRRAGRRRSSSVRGRCARCC
jgi:ZIP family zinc transporter